MLTGSILSPAQPQSDPLIHTGTIAQDARGCRGLENVDEMKGGGLGVPISSC